LTCSDLPTLTLCGVFALSMVSWESIIPIFPPANSPKNFVPSPTLVMIFFDIVVVFCLAILAANIRRARQKTNDARTIAEVEKMKAEKARAEIEKLNEFSKKLNETTDLDEILDSVLMHVREAFPINAAFLYLIESSEANEMVYYRGIFPSYISSEKVAVMQARRFRLDESGGVHYKVFQRKRAFYLPKFRRTGGTEYDWQGIEKLDLKSILIVPLLVQNTVIGLLDFTNYRTPMKLSQSDIASISRFCEQIAGAIHSSSLLKQTEEARSLAEDEKLNVEKTQNEIEKLNEFSKRINEMTDLNLILDQVFDYLDEEYDIDAVIVLMVDDAKQNLYSYKTTAPENASPEKIEFSRRLTVPLNEKSGLMYRIYQRKRPMYLANTRRRFPMEFDRVLGESLDLKSWLITPLLVQHEVIALVLFTSYNRLLRLSKADIASISRFCEQIAGAIHGSSLLKQVRKEQEKSDRALQAIQQDLEKAKKIQQSLIPQKMPDQEGLKIAARYIPMDLVGGDLFDFIEFPNNRFGIFVADVSGHGIAAAMVSSMAKLVLSIFGQNISSPAEYLAYLNTFLEGNIAGNFLTCVYAIFDPAESSIVFANAGHPPLLHIRNNNIVTHTSKGKFIGVFSGIEFEEQKILLEKGDRLLFYTDGIDEASNPEKEEFGEERLLNTALGSHNLGLDHHLDAILRQVIEFQQSETMQDDVTLVGIEVL